MHSIKCRPVATALRGVKQKGTQVMVQWYSVITWRAECYCDAR